MEKVEVSGMDKLKAKAAEAELWRKGHGWTGIVPAKLVGRTHSPGHAVGNCPRCDFIAESAQVEEEDRRRRLRERTGPMPDDELALRCTVVVEHFASFGMRLERASVRVQLFVVDTAPVPIALLAESLQLARRQKHNTSFPPTAGEVIERARLLHLSLEPELHRMDQGGTANPNWYGAMNRNRLRDWKARLPFDGMSLEDIPASFVIAGLPQIESKGGRVDDASRSSERGRTEEVLPVPDVQTEGEPDTEG